MFFFPFRKQEFFQEKQLFAYQNLEGQSSEIQLEKESLAFTYCQVPVVYVRSVEHKILLHFRDGSHQKILGDSIDAKNSSSIFGRQGIIIRIDVWLAPEL